ncbi:MAG: MATE family efflux transporter [Oscillospiraceae bacterium]
MANNENKMGNRPIFPLLMSMAFPAMLSMFIQSMYNIVDSMFVARISENALTAVSLAFPIQYFILSVGVGTGIGINSLISRYLGKKNIDEANSTVTHGLLLAVITGVIFLFLGTFLTKPFFGMFTENPEILKYGIEYTSIVTIFSIFSIIHIAIEKILQATGNMIYPMIFQAVGAIVNIILDPIMIFGLLGFPELGVSGAAIATVIGQFVSMLLSIIVLITQKHDIKIKTKGFKPNLSTIKKIYAVGFPSIIMMSLSSLLVMGLNKILIGLSEIAVSVFGIYFKLQSFVFMTVSGLSQGAMPIMGYNYGAGNRSRLTKTLKASLAVSIAIMLIGSAIFLIFPKELLLLFKASDEMLKIGIPALRIISTSYFAAAFGFIFSTFFQAIGKGSYSLFISLIRQIIIILPLAYILAKPLGLVGVWITFPIMEIAGAAVSLILYAKIRKKLPDNKKVDN